MISILAKTVYHISLKKANIFHPFMHIFVPLDKNTTISFTGILPARTHEHHRKKPPERLDF
jgi:hypothetical protein